MHCVNILILSLTEQSFFYFIARDESEVVIHSDDAFAPVGFLHFKRMHVEQKELNEVWKNDRIVPDNINLLFTERKGYTEKYWPEDVIIGISNCNHSWSGYGFLLVPYNHVL